MWLCMMDEPNDGSHCREITNWHEIEVVVDAMDKNSTSWIQIGLGEDGFDPKWFDVISGDSQRVFVSYRTDDDDYILLDPVQTETILVRNPPQFDWIPYDPMYGVAKNVAKRVLKHFFDHHERLVDGVSWEEP